MRGLVLSTLAGLIIASIGSSYADIIRVTALNESAAPVNLIMPDSSKTAISTGAIKMFSTNYTYPAPISFQSLGKFPKKCDWSMQPVGKQSIKTITLNISNNTASPCLISWQ
jgi:hypothetical protein